MTLLAMILCHDPSLLAERGRWLAAQLQQKPDVSVDVRAIPNGVVLLAQRGPSVLHTHAMFEQDCVGRYGWSKSPLKADAADARACFDAGLQNMPTMSALWCWQPRSAQLRLATDPLGARPLFYAHSAACITVSSALWLLESCPWIDTSIDEAALHQRLSLGYCLGNATPYRFIRRVQGGSEVTVPLAADLPPAYRRFHHWDKVATDHRPLETQLDNLHSGFLQAVADQDDGNPRPFAALSGGLDTRVVIAGLIAAGRQPTCLTFTWRNSLDGAIAKDFAHTAQLSQRVVDVPRPLDEPFLIKSARALDWQPLRLWTGYGGSIGAGYVHSNSAIIAQAREGNLPVVARMLMQAKGVAVSKFLFGGARARQLTAQLEAQLIASLEAYVPDDAGRRLQLYLLEHQEPEQLRPLTENADHLGIYIAAPFYDPQLLEAWLAVPLEQAMYHNAYVQWLQRLPAVVLAVPWQAYPGHVPPPQPLPAEVDQWSDNDAVYFRQHCLNDLAVVKKCANHGINAARGLPLWRQWCARGAVALGQDRQSYLLRQAAAYAAFEHGQGSAMLDRI